MNKYIVIMILTISLEIVHTIFVMSSFRKFIYILSSKAHESELAAFISYAMAFPKSFVALVDTYDVSKYEDNIISKKTTI